ncbi:site-specific DNA-methyltransferase [Flectobacillus major]|uniref:site-specific DNA-methyltransferase n=1 Tax=Flectobacillus major TaxID=103 RepID=UPI0003F66501|nr:site-specific DNA-methyltransferase [Flectobacillus major]
MDGASLNITQDLIQKLKEIVPQAFTEDKIDISRLQTILGDSFTTDAERYGLSWAGKSEAYKVLQSPSTATLIPNPDQSIDWDNAENIFIEGENLEVLKVLQKSYYGKVKMIYIDPPYNTGNDSFIYPDKFSETKEEYLKRIGDKDDDGFMMKQGLFRKNNKENGQFHSNWLNMMLPRLFLARNLLKDDGVIFVSIDDNEQANLKILMDEIFGEENFIVGFIWQKGAGTQNDNKYVAVSHEYVLLYAKNKENCNLYKLPPTKEMLKSYNLSDEYEKERGKHYLRNLNDFSIGDRPGLHYDIVCPDGTVLDGKKHRWRCDEKRFSWRVETGRIVFEKNTSGKWDVLYKQYLFETKEEIIMDSNGNMLTYGKIPDSLLIKVAMTGDGTKEIKSVFDENIFSYPKPTNLIKHCLQITTKNNDIVVDFFAGSGTTAQAVMELNEEDGGNRKYICVQLPELTDEKSEAFKANYKTISQVTQKRIKKIIDKIKDSRNGKLELEKHKNLGFRKYTLASSNFKIWRGDVVENEEDLIKQMQLFTTPQKENTQSENILWELLIKNGVPLTEKIESITLQDGAKIYYTANKKLAFVLDSYTDEVQTAVLALKPKNIICLDSLFHNNDNVKTNAQLKFEDNGISFKTI